MAYSSLRAPVQGAEEHIGLSLAFEGPRSSAANGSEQGRGLLREFGDPRFEPVKVALPTGVVGRLGGQADDDRMAAP